MNINDSTQNNDGTKDETMTAPAATENDEEKREMYDVIICGTDLIQSILSSALSRAGKKVLHCDGNDWYGGFDAVLYGGSTLELFIEGCKQHQEQEGVVNNDDNEKGKEEDMNTNTMQKIQLLSREKYGDLRLHSRSFVGASTDDTTLEKLSIQNDDETRETTELEGGENKLSKEDDTIEKDTTTAATSEDTPPTTVQQQVNPLENGFCFDLTPSLLFASGEAVDCLVKSGVADYLEFKSLKGLYLLMEEEEKSPRTARSGRRTRNNTGKDKSTDVANSGSSGSATDKQISSYRVPCSKGDVFKSKLLSPIDKRRLMKFLQLISDYGMATQVESVSNNNNTSEEEVTAETNDTEEGETATATEDHLDNTNTSTGEDAIQSINERHLHRGRALSRPQNKATPSSSEMDALMQCVRDDTSFSDFLTKVAKLPERLSTVVFHALALAPFGYAEHTNNKDTNDRTKRIAQYSTREGVDDLVRHLNALGRFGNTAFLVSMYGSGELSQSFCRSGAVYGSTYMLRRSPLAIFLDGDSKTATVRGVVLNGEEHIGGSDDIDTDDVSDRELPCKHVIVPSTMMPPSKGSKTHRQARTYRRISILQGKLMMDQEGDVSDTEQRHAIIIPPGTIGLEIKSAIHGVAVDDSAFVAPPLKNYTVLHLTTSSQVDDDTPDEVFVNALSKAVEYLIASQSTKDNDASPILECHHISFSYSAGTAPSSLGTSSGLHICHRDQQSLTCDSAFREAKRIFHEICPDSDFLALAKKVEDAIVYRDEHDSDDERNVLESACTMIQAPPAPEKKPTHDASMKKEESGPDSDMQTTEDMRSTE